MRKTQHATLFTSTELSKIKPKYNLSFCMNAQNIEG